MTFFKSITTAALVFLIGVVAVGCNSKSTTEIACGGSMNFACPADMYCNMKEECGGIDRNGVCTLRPTQCNSESKPICGCDGETYSNSCLAAAKGVTLKEEGECKTPPPADQGQDEEEIPEDDSLDDGITGE